MHIYCQIDVRSVICMNLCKGQYVPTPLGSHDIKIWIYLYVLSGTSLFGLPLACSCRSPLLALAELTLFKVDSFHVLRHQSLALYDYYGVYHHD